MKRVVSSVAALRFLLVRSLSCVESRTKRLFDGLVVALDVNDEATVGALECIFQPYLLGFIKILLT